jgi:hypothetical protein
MRVENTLMDVYVNGTITSTKFTAVPKQNYNDVQICQNGGGSKVIYRISGLATRCRRSR